MQRLQARYLSHFQRFYTDFHLNILHLYDLSRNLSDWDSISVLRDLILSTYIAIRRAIRLT